MRESGYHHHLIANPGDVLEDLLNLFASQVVLYQQLTRRMLIQMINLQIVFHFLFEIMQSSLGQSRGFHLQESIFDSFSLIMKTAAATEKYVVGI